MTLVGSLAVQCAKVVSQVGSKMFEWQQEMLWIEHLQVDFAELLAI